MKITFIYPGYENLGIEYLSSALRKAGHETSLIFDPVLFSDPGGINIPSISRYFSYSDRILKEISSFGPQLICFSCGTDDFHWALNTADKIKRNFSIPIVFGGIHASSVPEKVIGQPCIDFICLGEGEEAIVELAQELEDRSKNRSIRNIWFKDNGNIISNEVRPLKEDLDDISFPDKELYYDKYRSMFTGYTIITSRGCPHSCSYCINSILRNIYHNKGRYLRRRSVENVIEELSIAKARYKPKFIHFCDEVFTCDKEWLAGFTLLYKKNIDLPFACYVSPSFADEETVGLLREGGCYKAQMGVQSLNAEKRRDLLNRHYHNEDIVQAIKSFRKNKIYLTCDNIFGLPGEDERELLETAKFYLANRPNHTEVFWLKYYPAAPIINIAKGMGLIDGNKIEDIENGFQAVGIARGGDTYKSESSPFQLFLNLLQFLPKPLCNFILKRRIYRLFPRLRPIFITVFFRFFNRAKFDLYTSSTFRRYFYFIWKRLSI